MLSRLDDDLDRLDSDRPLVVFLGDDIDEEDHDLLFPELRARGVAVVRIHPHELTVEIGKNTFSFSVAGTAVTPDLVVGWVLDELLYPGMAHLEAFRSAGIRVINDAATLFRAQSKYLGSVGLAHAGVLNYPVLTGRDPKVLADWLRRLGGPAVLKPLSGFGGQGLRRVDGEADIDRVVAEIAANGQAYYAVPWIPNPGRDIRVYTINHHPVFAMYRYAPAGEWITNVRQGGSVAMCPLTPQLAELARRASVAAGTLIGGVDIGENSVTGELVVYETNSCPTCEPPVLRELAGFLAAVARDPLALDLWRPEQVHEHLDPDPTLFHASKKRLLER